MHVLIRNFVAVPTKNNRSTFYKAKDVLTDR